MAQANFTNRTVWVGDNLHIMRGINSECIDLIYLDPPFNSNQDYAAPIGSIAAGAAFKDTWTLSDIDVHEHGELAGPQPRRLQCHRGCAQRIRQKHDELSDYDGSAPDRDTPHFSSQPAANLPALRPDRKPLSQAAHGLRCLEKIISGMKSFGTIENGQQGNTLFKEIMTSYCSTSAQVQRREFSIKRSQLRQTLGTELGFDPVLYQEQSVHLE